MTEPVLLAGAGPGDPDLLTLRAEAALAAARLVVADPALIPLVAAFALQAEVVAAGPDPSATADRLAAGPAPAVRLYRGDPWLHAAYAAEAAALAARGVPTEPVPGPPVETALAGAAGLALHHRPLAVTLTLGPLDALPAPADPARTLVAEVPDTQAAALRLARAVTGPPAVAVVDGTVHRDPPSEPGLLIVGAVAG